jgi:hypothetical protein
MLISRLLEFFLEKPWCQRPPLSSNVCSCAVDMQLVSAGANATAATASATPAATPAGQPAANLAGEGRDVSMPMSAVMTKKIRKKPDSQKLVVSKDFELAKVLEVLDPKGQVAAAAAGSDDKAVTDELLSRMAVQTITVPLLLDPRYDPTGGTHDENFLKNMNPIFLHCLEESPAFNDLRRVTELDVIARQTVAVPFLLRLLPPLDEDEWWTTGAKLELAWILLAMTRSYEYGVLVPEKGPNAEWVSTFIARIAHNAINPAFTEEWAGVPGWQTNEGMLGEHRLWSISMIYYALEKNQKWFLPMEELGICLRDEPRLAECDRPDTRLLRNSCECWFSSLDPEAEIQGDLGDVD